MFSVVVRPVGVSQTSLRTAAASRQPGTFTLNLSGKPHKTGWVSTPSRPSIHLPRVKSTQHLFRRKGEFRQTASPLVPLAISSAIAPSSVQTKVEDTFIEVTSEAHFEQILAENDESTLVVLCITAKWCKGCKAVTPMLDVLAMMWPHICWVRMDVDKNRDLIHKLNVNMFPLIQMYRGASKLVDFMPSAKNPQKLKQSIELVDTNQEHCFMVNGGKVCLSV